MGDDLYCHQPICESILTEGFNFILVCKPDSHKTLYEWTAEFENMGEIQILIIKRWTGKCYEIDTYRFNPPKGRFVLITCLKTGYQGRIL